MHIPEEFLSPLIQNCLTPACRTQCGNPPLPPLTFNPLLWWPSIPFGLGVTWVLDSCDSKVCCQSFHLSDCHLSFLCHSSSVSHFGSNNRGMGIEPSCLHLLEFPSQPSQHCLMPHHSAVTLFWLCVMFFVLCVCLECGLCALCVFCVCLCSVSVIWFI